MVGRDTPYGARLANDFVCFRQGKGLARLDVQKLTQINRSEWVVVIEDRPGRTSVNQALATST